MKQVKISNLTPQQINWDKPQWLINDDCVILTTGEHEADCFVGTVLPCQSYPVGLISNSWYKPKFQRLAFDIPFTISNE